MDAVTRAKDYDEIFVKMMIKTFNKDYVCFVLFCRKLEVRYILRSCNRPITCDENSDSGGFYDLRPKICGVNSSLGFSGMLWSILHKTIRCEVVIHAKFQNNKIV